LISGILIFLLYSHQVQTQGLVIHSTKTINSLVLTVRLVSCLWRRVWWSSLIKLWHF